MPLSRLLFRILLLAYPKRVRKQQGADMWLTFERHLHDARRVGRVAVINLWRREVIALWRGVRRARVSIRKHLSPRRHGVGRRLETNLARMEMSLLDFKLGLRMLVKYPGLSFVAGMAMAVTIAVGAFMISYSNAVYRPPPAPLDEFVAIHNWITEGQLPPSVIDFETWRDEVQSVEGIGAFVNVERNLIIEGGAGEPVPIAAISPSAFRLMEVSPLLGRPLLEEDYGEAAPPVLVIGYDAWQTRFASDPAVLGQEVRLGSTIHTVVGVMPEGFAFPVNHRFWIPLQLHRMRGRSLRLHVFGRLAPGVTRATAQAEFATMAVEPSVFPGIREQPQPRVRCYWCYWSGGRDQDVSSQRRENRIAQLLFTLFLLAPIANVAVLIYARTATRQREIAVRTALGAGRRRIVTQLFVEVLVLAAAAAVVGLLLVRQAHGLGTIDLSATPGGIPFWLDYGIDPATFLYVAGLTILAALVAGVAPALQATSRGAADGLRQGDGTAIRLGRNWTALIVVQVAVSVAVLPTAVYLSSEAIRYGKADPGFPAEEYLAAGLVMDRDVVGSNVDGETEATVDERGFDSRFRELRIEWLSRLKADPGVLGVTFAERQPGLERWDEFEMEGGPAPPLAFAGHLARFGRVDVDFFDTFGVPLLAGRRFASGDLDSAAATVVVNRTFVRQVLGGDNPLGRRVRSVRRRGAEPGPWFEIIGVVGDIPANPGSARKGEGRVYRPVAPGQLDPLSLAVRVGPTPVSFEPQLRAITTTLDPNLRLQYVVPLNEAYLLGDIQNLLRLAAWTLGLMTMSVLFLSSAGVYALTSVTVTRRRREIGIRVALGALPHRILGSIFSRTLVQLALGVVVGSWVALLIAIYVPKLIPLDEIPFEIIPKGPGVLLAVAAVMITAGLIATVGPARRGLSIEPTEALKADG